MKKTLMILLSAACATASATLSYKTTSIGTPDAAYVHGFTFSIKAETISPANETVPKTFTGDYYLNKLTLQGRKEIRWPVSFKLMVLEPESNRIIGLSNETRTTAPGSDSAFTFNNLKLSSEVTYLIATVAAGADTAVLGKTYSPSTANLRIGDTTVSGGLEAPGFGVDLHNEKPTSGLNFTVRANLSEAEEGWSPILPTLEITDANPPQECNISTPIAYGIGGVALLAAILAIGSAARRKTA